MHDTTAPGLPLGSDGQPHCLCEHERQKHFGDRFACYGVECRCKAYEPAPVDPPPEGEPDSGQERAKQLAAAYALIEEDRQQRMAACLADIETVLDKHGMTLDTIPARVVLTPRDQT